VRWQKQVFVHTPLSRAYLALARLSCSVVPTPATSDTPCTCKFKMVDGNRKYL